MGRTIALLQFPPRRIISLVPSQTEFLYDLGLENEVLGITKFCVHPPEWFQTKARVGGTKTLNVKRIEALRPDLIIGNKEENEREQIEMLAQHYPVWMSDIHTLNDAYDMMRGIGELCGKVIESQTIVRDIQDLFAGNNFTGTPMSAAYFIWRKPYLVAGNDTFIQEMLRIAGFDNVFAHLSRYLEITLDILVASQPEVILLSSEPYPFAEKHFAAFREVCPKTKILLVDGELFSWYGSRLRQAPTYFRHLRETLQFAGI